MNSISTSFKKTGSVILMIMSLLGVVSCSCKNEDDSIKRTVLVYIAADNNLSNTANPNIYSMSSSIRNGGNDVRLLAFVDRMTIVNTRVEGDKTIRDTVNRPVLLHLHGTAIDTVRKYPELDSTDPKVLREVIDYVRDNYKAESYGLVMWSHGTGWIPTRKLHYVAPNLNYMPARDGNGRHGSALEIQRYPWSAQTKAFGWENIKGNPPYVCMELDEMANAIPDGLFDFIAFDACYMGNVEVAYALRKKARYIVSSAYEIVSYGFPYHLVTSDLLEGNLIKVCREFNSYYNNFKDWQQMAGISLVRTEGLDSLASCFKKIVAEKKEIIPDMDIKEIQIFDRFRNHVFFDMLDVVERLDTKKEYLDEFKLQMDFCIPFKVSTPYIFPGEYEEIKVDKYCGLSMYIPLGKYDESGLNDDYRRTAWSLATGY